MIEKQNSNLSGQKLIAISSEEQTLLQNLIQTYHQDNNAKLTLILKIFLTYLQISNIKQSVKPESEEAIKEIIKSVRFNEIEVFLPCNNVEWILLEIGKLFLQSPVIDKSKMAIVNSLLETTTDLFKIVKDEYGLAVSNYLLAYKWFLEGNKEKSSRFLEMVAHSLKENHVIIWETHFYAALLNYETNLRRAINLLENCILFGQKYPNEVSKSKISYDYVEETLNKLRRDYIIREHEDQDKNFLFKVIDNVIHYYYNKNDLYGLSACYYESGIIFDRLGYEDTAEEYFVEAAIITSDLQEWKLYSKALINLVVKFFEKGRIAEAEDYLNDLIQVASYLKDESLHKKVETLLVSLKKIKEIRNPQIPNNQKLEEYISDIDSSTQEISNPYSPEQDQHFEYETNLKPEEEIDLIKSLDTLSTFTPIQNSSIPREPNSRDFQRQVPVDQTFLSDIKESLPDPKQNEITITNENLLNTIGPVSSKKKEKVNTFHAVRKKICNLLKESSFEIFTDYKPVKGSVSVDIVAMKGKIRKQKLFIMIASDSEAEIELSANLLISIFDTAERIVFVNTENKLPREKKGGVTVVYDIEQLPV